MLRLLLSALLALLASSAFTVDLRAQVVIFDAALDGAQEVPPVATAARGWGVVRFDPATNGVRIFVFHEALSGPPTAAHLHLGAFGVNGGVALPLAPASANTLTGVGVLAPAAAAALVAGGTYLNVHTAANPGGEIRGQVVVSASTRFTGVLSGAQEVPPNGSAATGTAVAFLHEPENRLVYMVSSNGLVNVTAAHVHQAPAGANGGVVFPLNGGAGQYCGVSDRLSFAQVAALMADGCYVNIHTAALPGGEIRAQLLKDAGDHFVAALDSAQQVPPNASPGLGSAQLTRDASGVLTITGAFAGLTGPPTAAHVHVAPAGANGGIVFPLTIVGSTFSATFTPTAAQLATLRGGGWYVNVHTAANPGGEIRGQLGPASVPTPSGRGCLGTPGVRPAIGAKGVPVVGTAMAIDLYGALPGSVALLAFGPNRDNIGPFPLPLELTTVGINAPTCFLLVDPQLTASAGIDPRGCATLPLPIPFTPSLRGARYYGQWFVFDPFANPGSFVASSALTLTVQ